MAGASWWTSTVDVSRQQEVFSSDRPVGSTKRSSSRVGWDFEPMRGSEQFLLPTGFKSCHI